MANKSFQKGLVVASLAGGVEGTFPEGEIEITENGEYDVTAYETATVNVAGGGEQAIDTKTMVTSQKIQSTVLAMPTNTTISIQ